VGKKKQNRKAIRNKTPGFFGGGNGHLVVKKKKGNRVSEKVQSLKQS